MLITHEEKPVVEVEVSFIGPERGGRSIPPHLESGLYRPHLVIGDGEYLGVVFCGPAPLAFGESSVAQCLMAYHPDIDYSSLVPGAAFEVREGARVVGYGRVLGSVPWAESCWGRA